MEKIFFYDTPIGRLCIGEENGAISRVDWNFPAAAMIMETPLIRRCAAELADYFAGKRKRFDLPLAPSGTAFQLAVWQELQKIPYGETRAYGEIAAALGKPKAARAVGMANHQNPIAILIPCHRVIGKDGRLVGYSSGLEKKIWLLELESGYGK